MDVGCMLDLGQIIDLGCGLLHCYLNYETLEFVAMFIAGIETT